MDRGDICSVCAERTIHLSASPTPDSLSHPSSVPSAPPAKHTPLYSSCWLAGKTCHRRFSPVPSSGSSEGSGGSVCAGVVFCRVRCHTSVCGGLIGVAAARADTNLVCQVGGSAWAAITFAEKQVTLIEVMLPQRVGGLNNWQRHWGTECFTQRLTRRRQWLLC